MVWLQLNFLWQVGREAERAGGRGGPAREGCVPCRPRRQHRVGSGGMPGCIYLALLHSLHTYIYIFASSSASWPGNL